MWTFAWIFILEAFAITAANAITIVIFTRTRRLHSKQYIMIINQAVADLFVGLVSVPMFIIFILIEDLNYPSSFKRVVVIHDSFFGSASLFGLVALATERAHATYFPFRHSTLGKGPYIIGIISMWAASVIVVVPHFVFVFGITRKIKMSVIGAAFLIISGAYSLIVLKVRCTITQTHDVTIQENKKLTVTLAVVTVLSLVTWLPYQCMIAVGFHTSIFISLVTKFLHYGNSLVNSVVYAFRMREIKREILRIFRCCRNNQTSIHAESELGIVRT